ncbi:hypothetical protein R3P38DRAFT_3211469 [Favolaschia claudopus]|uniref:Uncharacterized protein n=1 Tax=Favolaschia claudopus TaxID=2862362 RepID=A0AAW0AH61_9AGAR
MLFKVAVFFLAFASAVVAAPKRPRQANEPPRSVFTATREFKTLTDVAPYIVTKTTTMVWTANNSLCSASPTTTLTQPTGPGI